MYNEEQRSNKFITLLVMLVPLMLKESNRKHKCDKVLLPRQCKICTNGCNLSYYNIDELIAIALSNLFLISIYLNRQKIYTFLW